MNYLSAKETAEKWKVSVRRVVKLAKEGRIKGAVLVGNSWIIPENTDKPKDNRYRKAEAKTEFRYPLFVGTIYSEEYIEKYFTDDEKNFYEAQRQQYHEIDSDCEKRYLEIAATTTDSSILAGCYSQLFYHYVFTNQFEKCRPIYFKLQSVINEDTEHKKDLEPLLFSISSLFNGPDDFNAMFTYDFRYTYNEITRMDFEIFGIYFDLIKLLEGDTSFPCLTYETMSERYEKHGIFLYALITDIYLAMAFKLLNVREKYEYYINKAIEITCTHDLVFYLALLSIFLSDDLAPLLSSYPQEFRNRVLLYTEAAKKNYFAYLDYKQMKPLAFSSDRNTMRYIYYAVNGYTNKEISALEKLSLTTIANKYARLYETLGVSSKSELKEQFIDYFAIRTIDNPTQ